MNEQQKMIDNIIVALYPTPEEYMDNTRFNHLMDYACELDILVGINYGEPTKLVEYINKRLDKYFSTAPEHEACCDVASTIESLVPNLKNAFKY